LAVEGPSKADISCHDNKDGTVSVSYLPLAPGEYKVSVKYADKHIRGSPYTAKITGNADFCLLLVVCLVLYFSSYQLLPILLGS